MEEEEEGAEAGAGAGAGETDSSTTAAERERESSRTSKRVQASASPSSDRASAWTLSSPWRPKRMYTRSRSPRWGRRESPTSITAEADGDDVAAAARESPMDRWSWSRTPSSWIQSRRSGVTKRRRGDASVSHSRVSATVWRVLRRTMASIARCVCV